MDQRGDRLRLRIQRDIAERESALRTAPSNSPRARHLQRQLDQAVEEYKEWFGTEPPRPPQPGIGLRIKALRAAGHTYRRILRMLSRKGEPVPDGAASWTVALMARHAGEDIPAPSAKRRRAKGTPYSNKLVAYVTLLRNEGFSLPEIAADLNGLRSEAIVPQDGGEKWECSTIHTMLKRSGYQLPYPTTTTQRPPYGYRLDGRQLLEDEGEQRVVALVRSLKQRGNGYKNIIKELIRREIRPRSGRAWYPTVIRNMLNGRMPAAAPTQQRSAETTP